MIEKFDKFTSSEKEEFRKCVNKLLANGFICQVKYNYNEGSEETNQQYLFIERNIDILEEYFYLAGFLIKIDRDYGVIQLLSEYGSNKTRFNKFTTLVLYTLRILYEEKREEISLNNNVFVKTVDIIEKMQVMNIIDKKPANSAIHNSLTTLRNVSIIDKFGGKLEEATTTIHILPTILFIVSNERISTMYNLLQEKNEEEIL